jgi:hypothetical protein
MFKLRAFRLGNSFLLGLISLLTGCTFFMSHSAGADDKGTDCPPNWTNLSGLCYNGTITTENTGGFSCATSPTGRCCTYQAWKVYCNTNGTKSLNGYTYILDRAGESGKTCTSYGCR